MASPKASKREALRAQQAAAARAARNRRMIGVGAALVAVILVVIFAVIWVNQSGRAAAQIEPPNAITNRYGVEVGTNPTSVKDGIAVSPGAAKPGVPVVQLYADYQCPTCKIFDDAYGAKLNELAAAGEITFSVQIETFLDRLGAGKSTNPAIGAACADASGVFGAYHLGLYAQQPKEGDGFTDAQLRTDIPTAAGLSGEALTAFQGCYDSKATADFVSRENQFNTAYTSYWVAKFGGTTSADASAWNSTPLLTVNGKRLDLATLPADPNGLLAAIKAAAS